MHTLLDIPLERYITTDCDCLCVYDRNLDLIAFSKEFLRTYGKS